MSVAKFRKKPIVIEAIQFKGDNLDAITQFVGKPLSQCFVDDQGSPIPIYSPRVGVIIPTLEGNMVAAQGDWVIRGVKGEFYPCKPDIFEATYEPATESTPSTESNVVLDVTAYPVLEP